MPAKIVQDNRAAILAKYEKEVRQMLGVAALECQTAAINAVMGGPKSGRTYKIATISKKVASTGKKAAAYRAMGLRETDAGDGKSSFTVGAKIHRASAPGEAPATDTGNLAASIVSWQELYGLRAVVSVGAEYGRVLELGGVHIKPRPYLIPAFIKARRNLGRRLILRFRK